MMARRGSQTNAAEMTQVGLTGFRQARARGDSRLGVNGATRTVVLSAPSDRGGIEVAV